MRFLNNLSIQILIDNHDTLFPPADDEDEDDFHNAGGQDTELDIDLENISLDDLKVGPRLNICSRIYY